MMVFARGVAKLISGGRKVTNFFVDDLGGEHTVDLPSIFSAIDHKVFGGNLSIVTIVFADALGDLVGNLGGYVTGAHHFEAVDRFWRSIQRRERSPP